jgi:hypothetical protein
MQCSSQQNSYIIGIFLSGVIEFVNLEGNIGASPLWYIQLAY